ncbi:unnamed protein product, partial [Ectocarpus sp. 12 AP-2014]
IVHRGKSILDISGFGDPASTENVLPIDNYDGRGSSQHSYLDHRGASYEYAGCVSHYGNACEARDSATEMSQAVGLVGKYRLSCWSLTTSTNNSS